MRIVDDNGARLLWNTLRWIKLLIVSILEHGKLKLGGGRRHQYDQSRLSAANTINVIVGYVLATIAINDGSNAAIQPLVVATPAPTAA